jgi:hypothetical protein
VPGHQAARVGDEGPVDHHPTGHDGGDRIGDLGIETGQSVDERDELMTTV